MNGDGTLDLAVANRNSNTVSVLLNNGDGTFAAKVDHAAASEPSSVAAATAEPISPSRTAAWTP